MMKTRVTLSLLLCATSLIGLCACQAAENPSAKRVNLEARDTPLSQVIDSLFKDTGLSYTIDPAVANLRVTAVLRNVGFEVALRQVARAAGIAYRVDDGGAYAFERPAAMQPRIDQPPPISDSAALEKLQLQFVEPPDVVPTLSAIPGLQVVSSGPSFVMVRGDERAIDKAKQLVRMVDTQDAYPQAVRIKLTARVTVQEPGKAAKTYEAFSESVGISGAPMPLRIEAASGGQPRAVSKDGTPAPRQLNSVEVMLVPVADEQGKISLSGQGTVRGDLPIHYEKGFEVAAACPVGGKTVIAAGGAELDAGKVDFEVSVTPTLEKERVKRPIGRPEPGFEPGPVPFIQPGGPPPPQPGGHPPGTQPPGQPAGPGPDRPKGTPPGQPGPTPGAKPGVQPGLPARPGVPPQGPPPPGAAPGGPPPQGPPGPPPQPPPDAPAAPR